jgi:PAS domain S-box-containing protein
LELNYTKLPERLRQANTAIRDRIKMLSGSTNDSTELRDLQDALQNLRVLQKEVDEFAAPQTDGGSHVHQEFLGEYVVFVNSERRYIEVTDGVCELLGYSREELLSKKIDDITAPELAPEVNTKFERYVADGRMEGNYALLAKDGHRVPIHFISRAFPDGCLVASWTPLRQE